MTQSSSDHFVFGVSLSEYCLSQVASILQIEAKALPSSLRAAITMDAARLDLLQDLDDGWGELAQVYREVRSNRFCSREKGQGGNGVNSVSPSFLL